MMVEERMDRGEQENSGWYEYREEDAQEQDSLDPAMEYVQRQEAEMRLHRQLQEAFYTGPAINVSDQITNDNVNFLISGKWRLTEGGICFTMGENIFGYVIQSCERSTAKV